MFQITNIKLSLKLQSVSLDSVENFCEKKKIYFKTYPNFIVIKTKYSYILFKENNQNINHLNITKIPSFLDIEDSIELFAKIINSKRHLFTQKTIDNITANFSLNKTINLSYFAARYKNDYFIQYKNETFSGLCIRFLSGTALLFHTGNVVVIGCNNTRDIKWIMKKIVQLTSVL
jgi:TATA-box binding protein (TBP) (component of TFIID and TFIIIB)